MAVASNPAYPASLAEQPLHAGRLNPATDGDLPPEVADLLRQRGAAGGSVLLLSDGESAALTSGVDFSAVALILEDSHTQELERILATIAPLLRPDTTLVATLPASREGDPNSIHLLLLRSGYDRVWIHSHRRTLRISAKRAAAPRTARICSIIVPVYNEKNTFPELMRTLLAKRLDHLGLEREIILVESNSTDGSRELVAGFVTTPGVKILWQDRPRGKGNAVRAGLTVATGDVVLIQDADLEYDVDDYDALLEPLLAGRAAFVLGSRHGGRLRMRRFQEQKLLGETLNVAHVLLAGFINILYGQNMKDPFTMFKVFRRECLYGLQFECNKFDFDHELVIKLVLKGYRPLEIPVNYCARSFKQGKKISFLRDPPGLIAADLKYRLRRLRPRFE
jgi:Glycosyl transferase family 2